MHKDCTTKKLLINSWKVDQIWSILRICDAKQTVAVTFLCPSRHWGRAVVFVVFFNWKNALSDSLQLHLSWCCTTLQWDLDYGDDMWLRRHSFNVGLQTVPALPAVTESDLGPDRFWPGVTEAIRKDKTPQCHHSSHSRMVLILLTMSSVCGQAGCGPTITNLKVEFPEALLMALCCSSWLLFGNCFSVSLSIV